VSIGSNPAEHHIKGWKPSNVLGKEFVPCFVNSLSVVCGERVKVFGGYGDTRKERVPCLLLVSVCVPGRDESFVSPPHMNPGPIERRNLCRSSERSERADADCSARHDDIGPASSVQRRLHHRHQFRRHAFFEGCARWKYLDSTFH
jgi:hypothetical protein